MLPGGLSVVPLLGFLFAADPPRLDRSGDPLPPRAVARLGTTRLRHGGWITGLAYSPDGKLLASASYDHTITVWELRSGRRLQSFDTLGGEGYALLFARGRLAALGPVRLAPEETLLQVWDIKTGKRLWRDS